MSETITIKQGDISGNIDDLTYFGAEGFQESNNWHVSEEALRGGANVQLKSGPATIAYARTEFPVTLTILEYLKEECDELDGKIEEEPVCEFEILPVDGKIERLAALLDLLKHYTPKQLQAAIG